MLKLGKYLKPFTFILIFAMLLLFVQAYCDLNIPNYTSDIVNVGIQQNGIENAAPTAISENGLTLMKIFMTDTQKAVIDQSYTLLTSGQSSQSDVDKYPLLATENVYVLTNEKPSNQDELNSAFGEASSTLFNFLKIKFPSMFSQGSTGETSMSDTSNLDVTKLYDMLPMLQSTPSSDIDAAREAGQNTADLMKSQIGIAITKGFYKELGMDTNQIQNKYIINTGILMLELALVSGIATVVVSFCSSKIATGIARNLRKDVFAKVESFSNNEFDKFSVASLITRTTQDITQLQNFLVMAIRMICYAPIIGVGGVIMALHHAPSMAWIIAMAVAFLLVLMGVVLVVAMPKFRIMQKLADRLNLVTREDLSGLLVIRTFGTQKFEENRFDKANQDITKNNLFINRVMMFVMPIMMLLFNLVSLLIVWVGAHQIANSAIQVGDMLAFMAYAMQVIMAFLMFSMMFIMVPRAAVSGGRVSEVLSQAISIKDPKDPKHFEKDNKGRVEFRDVSFRYEGADTDVLSNISFIAKPGETTAFIGSTGSGKSTLINLIPRFHDVTGGKILIDDIDIRDVTQHDLRDEIGYVSQKGILFSGTIKSNIEYGNRNADYPEIEKALEVAQAKNFVDEKEDGVDSEVSQGGTNVSGGQKQRLAIARALVKKPPIYIFDDTFSALDSKTDADLRAALKSYTAESTILIVAQRVSTIMYAEQIVVLDHGKIVGKGTHEELLKSCKEYYEIASSQLGEEKLNNE
ncbi:MAG: ABC transporter ATP-binding protein/permease [Oscillospiraceae bacterium]|nr:ABC transporter ATP-binding protein/permease [Oscillospiraceae bacterium]